jgi:hypothetical protein
MHPAACEAAAAVVMASRRGRGPQLEDWFFENRIALTATTIREAARVIGRVSDFERQLPNAIKAIAPDMLLGQQLGIKGTPAIAVNGVLLSSSDPAFVQAAVSIELSRLRRSRRQSR